MSQRIVLRSRPLVWFFRAAAVGSLFLFGAAAVSGPGPDPTTEDYVVTAVLGLVSAGGFGRATRMRVELDGSGATVFGYFTTESIPWPDIEDVSVDYGGLRLICTDGVVVTAVSLGKPNWATWFDRRVAADDRVELFRDEMLRRRRIQGIHTFRST